MQKAKIIVAVRKRPLFQKQKSKGNTDIIAIHNGNQVVVSEMKQKVDLTKYIEESVFNFDHAFDQSASNEQIYSQIMSPLIDSAFEGAKVSCFAYGQTGSGKTYTMNGVMAKNLPGLYTLGAYDIFERLSQPEFCHLTAYLSFYQIYCTKLFDLLNKRTQLILRQDAKSNINVVGLSQLPISNVQQFQNHLKIGSSQRVTSQNSANSQSSRSHAILQITLKNGKKGFGKVYFIDLAGNQRGADHMNQKKQTQIDGQQINKSLLQLKQCIRGLDQGKHHVPFRGSKLTMCLKDSFVGFCRTVMIGNISPSSASSQNTLNTLRYADRVKQLKNNDQISKQQLKSRQMMLPRGKQNAIKIAISNSDDQDDIAQKKRAALQQYGIKPQQKKINSVKQDNLSSDRRLSMGTSLKQNPQVKGNSVAKNALGNMSNRQIPSTKGIQPKKNNLIGKRQVSSNKDQLPDNMNRHISNQSQIQAPRYRNQPMEIQKPHGNSVDLRKNLSGIVNYGSQRQNIFSQNNSNIFSQQHHQQSFQYHNYAQHNQYQVNTQNLSNNQNSNQNQNQNPLFKANNFFSNSQNQQNNSLLANRVNQQPSNKQGPSQHGFSNDNNINSSPNSYNNNSAYNNNNVNNSYPRTNPHMHNQNHSIDIFQDNKHFVNNTFPRQNSLPPSHSMPQLNPQNWNEIVDCIYLTKIQDQRFQLRQKLNLNLLHEENQLVNQHSRTLQTQIQKIKSQMEVIKHMENNQNQYSSRDYAQMMFQSIDQKIGQLQLLKQKLATFMYKLDDMEEIQSKFDHNKRETGGQDEQLLDDYY